MAGGGATAGTVASGDTGVAANGGAETPIIPGAAGTASSTAPTVTAGSAVTGMGNPAAGGGAAAAAGVGVAGGGAVAGASVPIAGGASTGMGAPAAGSGAGGDATFSRVWSEILMLKGCSGEYCHGSGMGGLQLKNKRGAYDALVNVAAAGPACSGKGGVRVKPGMPDASLLLDKISHGTPSCGEVMPIGGKLAPNCVSMLPTVCTTDAELALVRDWILAGAKDD